MIELVLSGGQTGADLGGLRAARACGIPTGGWAPRGWLTEVGWLVEYGLDAQSLSSQPELAIHDHKDARDRRIADVQGPLG